MRSPPLAGYALKACPSAFEHTRLGFACHTDITALYRARGIDDGVFPYVGGALEGDSVGGRLSGYDLRLVGGANEYPVMTGLFMWTMGLLASDAGRYLLANAAFLSMKRPGDRGRSRSWSDGAASSGRPRRCSSCSRSTTGISSRWLSPRSDSSRGGAAHPTLAAVSFRIGGALKLYPLLLLLPLIFERWERGERRGAALDAAAAAATVAVTNLPIMLLDLEGWLVTYRFHSLRPPNYDSLWGVGPLRDLAPAMISSLSTLLLAVTSRWCWWRPVVERIGRTPLRPSGRGPDRRFPALGQGAVTAVRPLDRSRSSHWYACVPGGGSRTRSTRWSCTAVSSCSGP